MCPYKSFWILHLYDSKWDLLQAILKCRNIVPAHLELLFYFQQMHIKSGKRQESPLKRHVWIWPIFRLSGVYSTICRSHKTRHLPSPFLSQGTDPSTHTFTPFFSCEQHPGQVQSEGRWNWHIDCCHLFQRLQCSACHYLKVISVRTSRWAYIIYLFSYDHTGVTSTSSL